MKSFLIILGLILSCTFSDRTSFDGKGREPVQDFVIGSENQDAGLQDFDWKSQGILPSRTAGYSGENTASHPQSDPQTPAAGFSLPTKILSESSRRERR